MANEKLPQLPILTAVTGNDLFYVVDVSDTTDDPTGSSKQITRDEILTEVNQIDFNLTAVTTHAEGRVHWNDDIKSLEVDTENPDVQIQVGHEMVVRVYNNTGTLLTKGTVVYINGVQGQRPTVTRADYSGESTSASVIGLVASDINNGENGYVITSGILEEVNTIVYSAGTSLYLFTGGTYSSNKPQAPSHDVRIGKVIVSNATTGSIYVNIQNGYELDELHDVRITSATTNDVLVRSSYDGVDVWVNTKTMSGLTYVGATTVSATTISGGTMFITTTPTTGDTQSNIGRNTEGKLIQVGNCSTEVFIYSFSGILDNIDFYNDGLVKFGWDAPGNDLEFYMLTEPAGNTDMRALATFNYGTQQNTFITTPNLLYDLYGAGVPAGNQLNVVIVAEADDTYPVYDVELYYASSNVIVKIKKTKKI